MKEKITDSLRPTLCILIFLSLFACSVAPKESIENEDDGISGGGFEEASELFEEGVDPKETVFMTNDAAYWSPLGYTLWSLHNEVVDPFTERTVTCSKVSGDDNAGYGIIFCYYENADPEIGYSMLAVLLNTRGEYVVGEIVENKFYAISPWTTSDDLSQGYNQANTIRVTRSGNEFDLYLNDSLVYSFIDDAAPVHTGGDNGFIVVISPEDQFPQDTVHVRFTEQTM